MILAVAAVLAGAAIADVAGAQPAPAAASAAAAAPAKQAFDRAQAEEVVQTLAKALEDNFVFPDKGRAYAARLRQQLSSGAYASFPDGEAFAAKVTEDLQAVHKDGHLALRVVPPDERAGPTGPGPGGSFNESTILASGWLADGVAYISFRMFPGNEATLKGVRSFIQTHKDARTLIIDARQNRGGGLAEMDLLFSQLYAKPITLVQMDTREAIEREGPNPMDDFHVRKMAGPAGVVRREHFVTPAADQGRLATANVYLLTSGRTASAAEHLALSLKRTGRATLVGETTRGAGHFGAMVPMDKTFTYAAFIPVGRTFDPDTGEGWEGTGVAPNVAVPADAALDKALELAGVKLSGKAALANLR